MNRLDRYVLGRFLVILTGCLLAIAVVFVAIDYIGAIRTWADRDNSEIISYYKHALPYILSLVSPIAVLLSAMFTVAGFSRRLELSAMHGAGRPLWRILLPIWLASIAYSGFWVWAGENILPHANQERIRIRAPRQKGVFRESPWKVDFAWRAGPGVTFFFRDYNGTQASGTRTTVSWVDSTERLVQRVDAQQVRWIAPDWQFKDGIRRRFDSTGAQVSYERFDSLSLSIAGSRPEDLLSRKRLPDEMTTPEMRKRIVALRAAGEPSMAWEAEAEFRRSSPWITAIVSLIATALAALYGRRGQALAFGIGILLAFGYYVAVRMGLALGHAGTLDPLQSAWGAHVFFLALGLGLLWRASRT